MALDLPKRFLKEQFRSEWDKEDPFFFSPYDEGYRTGYVSPEEVENYRNELSQDSRPEEREFFSHYFDKGGKVQPQYLYDEFSRLPFSTPEDVRNMYGIDTVSQLPSGDFRVSGPDQYSWWENLGLPVPSATQDEGFGGLLSYIDEIGKKGSGDNPGSKDNPSFKDYPKY